MKQNKGEQWTTGAVIAAASGKSTQPIIKVRVLAGTAGSTETLAVADTGAMVCVAGPTLMRELGLNRNMLVKSGNLSDVAGRAIQVLGQYYRKITLGQEHTHQSIYFISSASKCFLSLDACKELRLIHGGFPSQMPRGWRSGYCSGFQVPRSMSIVTRYQ